MVSGAPRVSLSPGSTSGLRLTDEQRQRRRLVLPQEYSSMDLDEFGFIYATAFSGEMEVQEFIRRLTPPGRISSGGSGTPRRW